MNADRLLAHYERIADAPDALPRLRRFILDLAVRGSLVEQDPNDEPASELLKRIAAEKSRLVKAGKIRNRKRLPPVHRADIPVEDISGWIWVRLGEVSTMITKGSTPTSYGHAYTTEGVNFLKVESIKSGLLLPENITSFIANETHDFLARSQLAAGDMLFSIAGSIGICAVVTDRVLPANTNQALSIIRGTQTVFLAEFLLKSLQSSVAQSVMVKARGGAMNNISLDDIQNFVVPLPPLAEQHRIVAKVDELMALCARLEAARAEREATRDRLVSASLARLDAPDPETFQDHARFALNVLPALTARPDQIKQLRRTILNLAVRGKLVPQDPNDEPASELLKRIKKTRDERHKRKLALIQIDPTETDFDLPENWSLAPLIALGGWATGAGFPRSEQGRTEGPYFFLKVSDMNLPKNERVIVTAQNRIDDEVAARIRAKVHSIRTIIFPKIGGAIATNKRRILGRPSAIDNNCLGITIDNEIDLNWAHLLLTSLNFTQYQAGTAVPALQQGVLERIAVGIPPLAEQHRIVAKVDELMALCDRLEASLTTRDQTRHRLLDALLHEALEQRGQDTKRRRPQALV